MKYRVIIPVILIIVFSHSLYAIDIDGNDLDWDYVKKVTIKDISGGARSGADIRYLSWTMDDSYFYLLISFKGSAKKDTNYRYMLNIDTDFNQMADLNFSSYQGSDGEISYVNEYGEIRKTEKAGSNNKILMRTGSSVEYKISRSLLRSRFALSCAVWDEENHQILEATLWHYVELSRKALEEKPVDINVGIKHFSGQKSGEAGVMKVDGSLSDWAGIDYKTVSDRSSFYYQTPDRLYIIASKRVLVMTDEMVYYITVDVNLDGYDDFLLAIRSGNKGFIQIGEKVYKMEEYKGLEGAVGEQIEFGIPLELFPGKQFKASIGLWNEKRKEIYYYTAWKEYTLEQKAPEKKKTEDKKIEKIEEEIEKEAADKKKARSGVKDLLARIKDPKLKIQLEKFITQGVESELDLKGTKPAAIAKRSHSYKGIPYVYGRADRGGTDCSGLTYMIFKDFGITLSRSAQGQARSGTIIASMEDLQPGDLVFFIRTYPTSNFITHVGLYLGNNKFINASSGRYKKVVIQDITYEYWAEKFIFGTRGNY